MFLFQLFLVFFRIGLFAIGGAYSFLPLLQKETVEKHQWLSQAEFLDVLGMVKVFPGAISVKFATYIGYKLAGVTGAIIANIGNLLAPVVITLILAWSYGRYKNAPAFEHAFAMIQWVVFAMIVAMAFQTINVSQLASLRNILVVIVAFVLFIYSKIDPALIIVLAGCIGVILKY
jgi:chromate transporter